MVWVQPGRELVRTKPLRCSKVFMSDDLPTLERPQKETSGNVPLGNCSGRGAVAQDEFGFQNFRYRHIFNYPARFLFNWGNWAINSPRRSTVKLT